MAHDLEKMYALFPASVGASASSRRKHVGRRTANVRHGPWVDGGANLTNDRRDGLGLAPVIVEQLIDVLATIRDEGVTVLLVEQDVDLALSIADRAYVMETGCIVHSGFAKELIDDPEVRRAYLGL